MRPSSGAPKSHLLIILASSGLGATGYCVLFFGVTVGEVASTSGEVEFWPPETTNGWPGAQVLPITGLGARSSSSPFSDVELIQTGAKSVHG